MRTELRRPLLVSVLAFVLVAFAVGCGGGARPIRIGVISDCEGPFAADGLFAQANRKRFDVALAMFHDQGLVATKALDFERTVNVTLGLPVPRTSPDHGVAYSLAGKGKASSKPMVQALLKAAELARAQRRAGVQ